MEAVVNNKRGRRLPDANFWRGRHVALTGHTGFKGAWLSILLRTLGAKVYGYALAPHTNPNLFDSAVLTDGPESQISDIRDPSYVSAWLRQSQAEVVLHLAAQALVRESYADPVATMTTNFNGSLNVLEAVRDSASVRSLLVVTTDKVYRNLETSVAFVEDDPLGGHDPYSASKAACEILTESYARCFLQELGVATARAGNVIGGGDWSADRLLPDAVRAWSTGQTLSIRRPEAIRPWQHVLEPLCAYLILAEDIWKAPGNFSSFNLGPTAESHVTVREVVSQARASFGVGEIDFAEETIGPHEAGCLRLDCAKARDQLGVVQHWDLQISIDKTMTWYRNFYQGQPARKLCEMDIESFFA